MEFKMYDRRKLSPVDKCHEQMSNVMNKILECFIAVFK